MELKAVAELQQRFGERDGQMLASREQEVVATRNHDLDRAVLKTELASRALELERGIEQREQSLRLALGEAANLRASVLQWMRVGGHWPRATPRLRACDCAWRVFENKKPA